MRIETPRLLLRPLQKDDLQNLHTKLYSRENIMHYVHTGKPKTIEESERNLDLHIAHHLQHGFGFCAVQEKATGNFAGISGLKFLDTTGEVQVGFLLEKNSQRKGYATEAAKALLQYGFEKLQLQKIVAIARPDNTASRQVLEKCGLTLAGTQFLHEREWAYYQILSPNIPVPAI